MRIVECEFDENDEAMNDVFSGKEEEIRFPKPIE